jgi:putative phosphoesterase
MILGVMSDTHGNTRLMHSVADIMRGQLGASVIIHLGDDYSDAQELERMGHSLWAVPGLWCDAYRGWRVPKARVEEVDGIRVAFAHDTRDVMLVSSDAHITLVGHTHAARIVQENGSIVMNPGHLRRETDRGERASFGIIRVDSERVVCMLCETDGWVRTERAFQRHGQTLTAETCS